MRKPSTCSGLRSSTGSPWRRSWEVTKPRSLPCAAMASMASSRRVVSFPFFHPIRREHLGGGPVTSKPKPPTNGQAVPVMAVALHLPPHCPGLYLLADSLE